MVGGMAKKTRIVAVAMKKGGVAKTTSVIAIAAIAASRGIDVGIIDLDAQGSATLGLGYDLSDDAAAMLLGDATVDESWTTTDWGFRLIKSGPGTEGAERQLQADPIGGLRALTTRLSKATRLPELIILDTRPDEAHGVLNAYVAATEVWVIVETAPATIEALPRVIDTIKKVGESRGKSLPITAIIPTKFDARTRTDANVVTALHAAFGDTVTQAIPMSVKVRDAHGARIPLPVYAPMSPPSIAYGVVVDQLCGKKA